MNDSQRTGRLHDFFDHHIEGYLDLLRDIDNAQERMTGYSPELQNDLNDGTNRMVSACRALEQELGEDSGPIEEARLRFREAIAPWFDQSILMSRGLNKKPGGHPGDFETLEAIYDNRPLLTGIGMYLDQYFLNAPLAVAVRTRKDRMRDMLFDSIHNGAGFGGG